MRPEFCGGSLPDGEGSHERLQASLFDFGLEDRSPCLGDFRIARDRPEARVSKCVRGETRIAKLFLDEGSECVP